MARRDVFESHKPVEFVPDLGAFACELLALFLADKPVHALVAQPRFDAIAQEYPDYRKERIFKLLIEIASSYRLLSWRLSPKQKEREQATEVGIFVAGDNEDVRLSMHEACNKIIHADELAFDTGKIRRVPVTYIRDHTVYASGRKGRDKWMVALWIPEFCDAALNIPGTMELRIRSNQTMQPTAGRSDA
jgi:hypothetical protein